MLSSKPRVINIILTAILGIAIAETSALAKPEQSLANAEQDMTKIEKLIIKNSNFPVASKIIFPGILIEGNYAVAEWQTNTMEGTMYLEKNNSKWEIIGVGFAEMNYLQAIGMPQKEAKTIIDYMHPKFEPDLDL